MNYLLIYVPKLTNRIGYTFNLVFKTLLGCEYAITINREEFSSYSGPKLCYGMECVGEGVFYVHSSELLFQTTIEYIEVKPFHREGEIALFPTYHSRSKYNFDIFSAIFYLVSRYEEYLPHRVDVHGRFEAKNSLAMEYHFLHKPMINIWVKELAEDLRKHDPTILFKEGTYKTVLTVDIDHAYAYKHKGLLRSVGGFLSSLGRGDYKEILLRAQVIMGMEKDPYDSFDFLLSIIKQYKLKTIFFVLYGEYASYDENISYNNQMFQLLLKRLGDYSKIGIHPSYSSFDQPKNLKKEINNLSEVMRKPISRSRFHYIRFRLPSSYRELIEKGIEDDYSMGYPDEPGFRASICTPFPFYDLEKNGETTLILHPFCIMESTFRYHKTLSLEEVYETYIRMINETRAVNGSFYCIWHNESLGTSASWNGWKELFSKVIQYAVQK